MRSLLLVCCLGVFADSASANCRHDHKSYPQGGIACQSGFQFVCGEMGAWHKSPNVCDAKSTGEKPPVAPAVPANDAAMKDNPAGTQPASGKTDAA